ncbi:MAG TPA: peptidyl-prolyl cis-trans isomerase [Salinibacter sp.]|nr:peptidyl-prolyl cis-trans isomerase [Salinibacter sp.]
MSRSEGFLPNPLRGLLLALLLTSFLVGCESKEPPSSYAARVGDHYLTQTELNELMADMGPVPDSTEARQQVIEQWIERTLLLREAERLKLSEDPKVQALLEERRRSTLVSAMTNRIYENTQPEPSDEEVRTYFERHEQQLTLREPYVRVRHLATVQADSAREVRRRLRGLQEPTADSMWTNLIRRYAQNPRSARDISSRFLPEGRLFAQLPYVKDELANLREGQVAPIVEDNDQFHVLQLVRRIPEGTSPQLQWVEAEIRRRLRIRSRKQMYAREVQRLRNRAKANTTIEVP